MKTSKYILRTLDNIKLELYNLSWHYGKMNIEERIKAKNDLLFISKQVHNSLDIIKQDNELEKELERLFPND
jgi:hypothetical protein